MRFGSVLLNSLGCLLGGVFLFIRFALKIFWFQPVFFFQLFIWIKFPTATSAVAMAIGYFANLFFGGLAAVCAVAGFRASLYKNLSEKFSACEFTEFPCSAYLDEEIIEKADRESFQRKLGAFGKLYDFKKDTHIIVVGRGSSTSVPSQLFAFSIPYYHSYIFLRDRPEDLSIPQKYFVRHEVGHVLGKPQMAKSFLWLANRALFLLLFWAPWCFSWSREPVFLFILLVLVTLSLRKEIRERIFKFRLEDEISADAFALSTLSLGELRRVEKLSSNKFFLADNDLPPEGNAIRKAVFLDNLAHLLDGSQAPKTNIENITDTPINVVVVVFLVAALAYYSNEPSWGFVKSISLWTILPLSVFILLLYAFNFYLGVITGKILDDIGYASVSSDN